MLTSINTSRQGVFQTRSLIRINLINAWESLRREQAQIPNKGSDMADCFSKARSQIQNFYIYCLQSNQWQKPPLDSMSGELGFPILYKHGTWASPVLRLLEKAPIRKTVRSEPVTGCLLQGLNIAPGRTKVILWSLVQSRRRKAKFKPFEGFATALTARLMSDQERVEVISKSLNYRR